MDYAALALAIVAVVVALVASAKASSAARELEDARLESRRNANNVKEELAEQINATRRMIAMVADGAKPTREMILEAQLWRDVEGAEAQKLAASGTLRILDVRSPQETAGGIIPGAILIPVDSIEERKSELPRDGRPTLIYCAGGGRSAAACEYLSGEGFTALYNLAGGIGAWKGPLQRP